MRYALPIAAAITLLGNPAPARGDVYRAGRVHATAIVGFHTDVAAAIELRAGYGWGLWREQLPRLAQLRRVEVAVRGALGREDSLAVSLLAGLSNVSLAGVQALVGIDARLDAGDRNFGPIIGGALRAGPFGLHVTTWLHVVGDVDWGLTVGAGWSLGDSADPDA